jgi:hypothetical protein
MLECGFVKAVFGDGDNLTSEYFTNPESQSKQEALKLIPMPSKGIYFYRISL